MRAAAALRTVTALLAAGMIGYGVHGLLHDHYIQDPLDVLEWAVGGVVLHDGLWVPLLCLAGAALAKAPWTVRGGLIVAAALTAVGLPAVLHAGDNPNPTVLPLPYARNLLWLLAATAVVTLLLEAVRRARRADRWPFRPRRVSRRGPAPSGGARRH
ncbi:hypothetical protein ACGF12_37730 [Kitasatospora sp. NPDC048296]|uniref:hypothetical protein n=1 Tax=Kitasatospora sp. NPDC048296 TaxID=3364048 RepID=UPI00371FE5BB